MEKHENTVVVNIACGLDTRCYRMKGKYLRWYNVDLPETMKIRVPEDTSFDHCIDQYYEAHHLKPNIIVRTNQLATIQQLVATNTTAAFLLDHVLEESSDIVKRTVPGLLPAEIDLIWKSSRHLSPHLKNLITAARNI